MCARARLRFCVRVLGSIFCLRQGDTLVIDGSGWMFQLLQGQRVDHGGDYDLLHATIVREVGRLREASGIESFVVCLFSRTCEEGGSVRDCLSTLKVHQGSRE